MNFLFAYAGIPESIYDAVLKERRDICGDNVEFLSRSLMQKNDRWGYTESDSSYFIGKFEARLRQDHHNKLGATCFALIYIEHDPDSSYKLACDLFPSVLSAPVQWRLDSGSDHRLRASKNELVKLLKSTTLAVKKTLPFLAHEVSSRDNSTPLLLPIKNFSSKTLPKELWTLQTRIVIATEKATEIKKTLKVLEHHHPRKKLGSSERLVFVDDKKVAFNPPGAHRHGLARDSDQHPKMCLVSGRRRLGAPYDRAFHYDCTKGETTLVGSFAGCHQPHSNMTGNPHLNISPNDHTR